MQRLYMSSFAASATKRPIAIVWSCATLLSAGVLAFCIFFLNGLREDELSTAERDLRRYSLTIAEQADRSIKSLDLVQSSVIDYLLRNRQSGGAAALDSFGTLEINALLKEKLSGLPHIDAITLQSSEGKIINFSRDWPIPNVNVAFRDYFQALKNDQNLTTFVSSPAPSAITGAWALYIARRLTGPDGEFLGVVNGTIKLQYFEDLYTTTSLGEGSATALMRDDGLLLARHPRENIGKLFASESRILGSKRAGLVREVSPVDGKMRIKSAHGLFTTPMYILASRTEESILRSWHNTAVLFGGLSLGLVGLVFFTAGLIIRWWRQNEVAVRIGKEKALAEMARAEAEAGLARERELAAAESNRIKSAFLATMSHEIRTPMNGVLGMADLLSRTELSSQQQRLLGTITQSATTLLTIINDILDFSRIESGRMALEQRRFDLRESTESVIELFTKEAEKKGIELNLLYPAAVPSLVIGDAGRLRQVLTNLIGNAVKFTNRGEIAVRVTTRGVEAGRTIIQFEVRDTGLGIDTAAQAALFQPFAQADSSISRRFGGTGLGLSITKHLVSQMGGKVALTSELNVGTTVTFDVQLELSEPAAVDRVVKPALLAGQHVLIIATEGTSRDVLCEYLAECGAKPVAVSTADDALSTLHTAHADGLAYSVAFLCIESHDLARQIKSHAEFASLKLIKITNLTRQSDAAIAHAAGIWTVLRKPIRRSELMHVLEASFAAAPGEVLAEMAPVSLAAPVAPAFTGLKALLAEDNPVNQEVAKEYLRELGCGSEIAENGRMAIAAFEAGEFDVILMDCQMPEMDGLTACRNIRDIERQRGMGHIPIIAVTANAFDSDRQKCLAAGMDAFISKPFTAEQLAAVMSTLLLRRQAEALAEASVPLKAAS